MNIKKLPTVLAEPLADITAICRITVWEEGGGIMITEFHRTAVWDSRNEIFCFLFVFPKLKNDSWCAVRLKN